jgi:tryptophanyl-tRNA synthetase
MKKRLLSGIKPTGEIHIGNYFGAMKQFVDLQDDYENFIFIADYHALNQIQNPKELSQYTIEIAKTFLAIGLDPKKNVLFRQSDIKAVPELCWIFNCLTSIATLKLAHAYKDAVAKGKSVNMGLFDYPVLMAADILIYDSDLVPVGKDQQQHIEIAQETANKFNHLFGKTFKLPQALILENQGAVKGLDGKKMSKSYNNTIGLFENEEQIKKKIMSIVTDSRGINEPKNPETCNIFALHKLFNQKILGSIANRYKNGSISYKESKEFLINGLNEFLKPIREKKADLDNNLDYVEKILKQGAIIASETAEKKLKQIKEKIGIKNF